jgi:hypothetical protein
MSLKHTLKKGAKPLVKVDRLVTRVLSRKMIYRPPSDAKLLRVRKEELLQKIQELDAKNLEKYMKSANEPLSLRTYNKAKRHSVASARKLARKVAK